MDTVGEVEKGQTWDNADVPSNYPYPEREAPGGIVEVLQQKSITPVPEETARVARAAFPKGNLYISAVGTRLAVSTVTRIFRHCSPRMDNPQSHQDGWR